MWFTETGETVIVTSQIHGLLLLLLLARIMFPSSTLTPHALCLSMLRVFFFLFFFCSCCCWGVCFFLSPNLLIPSVRETKKHHTIKQNTSRYV